MVDVLERIKALIARTASASEEEARTSAVIACRLIRDNNIELKDPKTPEDVSSLLAGFTIEDVTKFVVGYMKKRGVDVPASRPGHSWTSPRPRRNGAAQAQASAYAEEGAYADTRERDVDVIDWRAVPFDPFTSSFETVKAYVSGLGVNLHNEGGGLYRADIGGQERWGTWPVVVRFMFSRIQRQKNAPEKKGICSWCQGPIFTPYVESRSGTSSGQCCSPACANSEVMTKTRRGGW